jgi:RNA polymerase subunit RPABC4/transcription elongation factor Spt4
MALPAHLLLLWKSKKSEIAKIAGVKKRQKTEM